MIRFISWFNRLWIFVLSVTWLLSAHIFIFTQSTVYFSFIERELHVTNQNSKFMISSWVFQNIEEDFNSLVQRWAAFSFFMGVSCLSNVREGFALPCHIWYIQQLALAAVCCSMKTSHKYFPMFISTKAASTPIWRRWNDVLEQHFPYRILIYSDLLRGLCGFSWWRVFDTRFRSCCVAFLFRALLLCVYFQNLFPSKRDNHKL